MGSISGAILTLMLLSSLVGLGLATEPDQPIAPEIREQVAGVFHNAKENFMPDEMSLWPRFRKYCCEGTGVYSEDMISRVKGSIQHGTEYARERLDCLGTKEGCENVASKAAGSVHSGIEGIKQQTENIKDKVYEGTNAIKDQASDMYHHAKGKVDDFTDRAKASVRDRVEGAKAFGEDIGDYLKDSAKHGVDEVAYGVVKDQTNFQ